MSDKDVWDKFEILSKFLGALITGIVLGGVGYFTTDLLKEQDLRNMELMKAREAERSNSRLYTEIMSNREKADTELRKEMFRLIIGAFLQKDKTDERLNFAEMILALELLAYNFHDVIDIAPLFKYVAEGITDSQLTNKRELRKQLESTASEVVLKQLAALSDKGHQEPLSVDFEKLEEEGLIIHEFEFPFDEDASQSRFVKLEVTKVYKTSHELRVRLESGVFDTASENALRNAEIDVEFKLGMFDFPLIDNTRVSGADRLAVALTRWADYGAELSVATFPSSRASLKEKPYYEEVINQLRSSTKQIKLELEDDL